MKTWKKRIPTLLLALVMCLSLLPTAALAYSPGTTSWNNIYRSTDYNGSGSSTDRSQVVVTFDSQGGSPVDSITYTVGQTFGALPTTTRPGYKFVCWMTRGNVGVNANTKVGPIGAQTLYAY